MVSYIAASRAGGKLDVRACAPRVSATSKQLTDAASTPFVSITFDSDIVRK